jgi:hypothetical protein
MTAGLLSRAVVPARLALICRGGETLGYNPEFNVWHHVDETSAEVIPRGRRLRRTGRRPVCRRCGWEWRLGAPSPASLDGCIAIILHKTGTIVNGDGASGQRDVARDGALSAHLRQ